MCHQQSARQHGLMRPSRQSFAQVVPTISTIMNMYMTHGRWERGGLEQRQGRAALVRDSKHAVLVVQVPLVPVGVQLVFR